MRVAGGVVTISILSFAVPGDAAPARKAHGKAGPTNGVQIPGVQIPFASLKADATLETPAKPEWIFFADSIFVAGPNRIDRIDPKTNKFMDPISGVKKPCGGMTSAFGSLWAMSCGDGSLAKIDQKTGKITATVADGALEAPGSVVATTDSIWILLDSRTTLARVDPDQMKVVATIRLPQHCGRLATGEKSLWVACTGENKVYRINPDTNVVEKRIDVSAEPAALAFGEGSVWVLCRKEGKLDRIDAKTNKVSKTIELNVPNAEGQIAIGEGSVWVTMTGFPIVRVDPKDETVAQQFRGSGGGAILASPGAIWLSNLNDGALWRIDPKLIKATVTE